MKNNLYCFVPAWYSSEEGWREDNQQFYHYRSHSFDDSIHQIRMFEENHEETMVLNLAYSPTQRRFLHRQGMDSVSCCSVFDLLQGVDEEYANTLFFDDMKWGQDIYWVRTPFFYLGLVDGQRKYKVEFGIDGTMVWFYEFAGDSCNLYYIDDRGFISSCIHSENGQRVYWEYYNTLGEWRFRCNLINKSVEVNPKFFGFFKKREYANLEEMIAEFSERLFSELSKTYELRLIMASSPKHDLCFSKISNKYNKVYSFFSRRNKANFSEKDIIGKCDFMVCDTEFMKKDLVEFYGLKEEDVYVISPYDTRLTFGKSSTMKKIKIMWIMSQYDEQEIFIGIVNFSLMILKNNNIEVLVVIDATSPDKDRITELMKKVIINEHYESLIKPEETVDIDTVPSAPKVDHLFFKYYRSEEDIIKLLDDVRLIVDMGDAPDNYIQIAAISTGIPQINRIETGYVYHKKNGYLVDSKIDLMKGCDYYLTGLENWNQALVYNYHLIKEGTSDKIVERWREIIEDAEEN